MVYLIAASLNMAGTVRKVKLFAMVDVSF